MTYLQLVNKVLLKLRENSVATLSSNYAQLIGDLVNEAKNHVESAWQWKCLTTTVTFNTAIGQETYDLTATTGSGGAVTSGASTVTTERTQMRTHVHDKEAMIYCTTLGARLTNVGYDDLIQHRVERITATNVAPSTVAVRKTNAGVFVELYDPADAVYAMSAIVLNRQADLSNTTDVLLVPSRPVILLAAAMATGERGSGKGQKAEDLYRQADLALQEAMDSDMEGDEMDLIVY